MKKRNTHICSPVLIAILLVGVPPFALAQNQENTEVQTSSDVDEAKERFSRGISLAQAGNCQGAIAELEESYRLAPRPNTLYNIAKCHEELFRYNDAVARYEEFLKIAPPDDPDRPAVESTIRTLKGLLGTIKISSNTPADVWVGATKVGSAPGEILVPGGHHVIELRAQGHLPSKKEIDIAGRQQLNLSFELEEAKKVELTEVTKVTNVTNVEDKGLVPTYFWSGVGLSAAAFVGGSVFGLRARSKHNDAKNIDSRLPRQSQVDDIDTNKNIADVFFISAGVLAVGTAVLFFLTDWDGDKPKDDSLSLTPTLMPGGWGFAIGGAL